MKIVIVNLDFPPVSGPGVWRVLALSRHASEAGHQVTVFCSDRSSWHDRADEKLLRRIPQNVRVVRIRSLFLRDILHWLDRHTESSKGLVRKIFAGLRWRVERLWPDPAFLWGIKTAIKVALFARRNDVDCVITSGPQHISHLSGRLGTALSQSAWIMDYRDPWTGFNDGTQMPSGPYQERLASWMESDCQSHADAITVVSPSWRNALEDNAPARVPKSRFHLIRNGHDLPPLPVPAARSSLIGDALWLHFNGTVQPHNDLVPVLIEAAEKLVESGMEPGALRLSFCGLRSSHLERIATSPAGACFVDFGAMSQDESLSVSLAADVLMILAGGKGRFLRGTIPGKTYEAIALGKPIIGILPPLSDVRDLLSDYPGAVLTDDDSSESAARTIQYLLEHISDQPGLKEISAEQSKQHSAPYDRHNQSREFLDLAQALCKARRPHQTQPDGI